MNTKIIIYDGRKILSENDTDSRYETVFERDLNRYDIEEIEAHIKDVGLVLNSGEDCLPHYKFIESFVTISEKEDCKKNSVDYVILVGPDVGNSNE